MPSRRQRPISLVPLPRYGLNDKHSPFAIHPLEASRMENIEIDESDAFSRLGFSQFGDTSGSGPIQNMHDHRESGGTQVILRARQDKIEKYNTVTDAWVNVTLPITITANKKMSFATLNDVTICANGTDSDLSFDGAAMTELASNPKADVQMIYQNQLVKFKFSNATIYWSDINDPTTFDALNFLPIDPNNGQRGKGLSDANGQIVVFKDAKKYMVTALIGGSVIPLDGEISTVSHYSIVSTGTSLIWLSTSGWYELRGTQTYPISAHIDHDQLNESLWDQAHAVFFENAYRCLVPEHSVGYNNLEYVIHLTLRTPFADNPYAITKNRGLNGLCYVKTLRSGQETLYAGDSRPDSGSPTTAHSKVYQLFDGFSDDGSEIAAYWEGRLDDAKLPFYAKKYKRAYVRVVTQTGLVYKLAHRFGTEDAWNEQTLSFSQAVLPWIMDDASQVSAWDDGVAWIFEGATDTFVSLTNSGKPRTIQFRNRVSSAVAQARWIYESYQYRLKDKFK